MAPSHRVRCNSKRIKFVILSLLIILSSCSGSTIIRPVGRIALSDAPGSIALTEEHVIAASTHSLYVIDIRNPMMPSLTAAIEVEPFIKSLAVSEKFIYVGMDDGLMILAFTDPRSPTVVSSYTTAGNSLRVTVHDDFAFIAGGTAGLLILDVKDPTHPVLVARLRFGDSGSQVTVNDVNIYREWAFVSIRDHPQVVLDISDPARPLVVSRYDDQTLPPPYEAIQVHNEYGYVSTGGGVVILDMSVPVDPRPIAYLDIPEFVVDLEPQGSQLLVTDIFTLRVIDVTDPQNPTEICHFRGENPGEIVAYGKIAIVADKGFGLFVFDTSTCLKR